MPVYAQLGGLEVLEEIGADGDPPATRWRSTEDLIEQARARGLEPEGGGRRRETAPASSCCRATIPPRDVRRLAEAGIITDSRPGHVRVSPYFYNVPDDHRAASSA